MLVECQNINVLYITGLVGLVVWVLVVVFVFCVCVCVSGFFVGFCDIVTSIYHCNTLYILFPLVILVLNTWSLKQNQWTTGIDLRSTTH